ncbi:hypothetical protein FEM48_Zijuj09G0124000 [Ziziphus jujuba var. spinosa]|uniref:Transcription factor bHLH95-like n=1 Tax=Ziziphus jujuba var. spinosa TaxID=714518 RepID=A0A978USZ7_ZIZJJ|nr:hypothetical protein FEM48_Zijuj09G0124000 [Ziziphus jujuba var. spinosa]
MPEALAWENPSSCWPNLSNSDNSAGHGDDHDHHLCHRQELKSDRKHIGSSSDDKEEPPPQGKKRGRVVLSKNGKGINCGGGGGDQVMMKEGKVGGESDHEIHIWTERERRKKMRNMFANLHALLPQLPPKADKSTIVDEAVNYIKNLEQTLQKLQKQKLEKLQSATATFNHEPTTITTITPQRLGYDQYSREAFLADQGSCSSNLPTTSTANIIDIPSASASLIPGTTSHSPVMFQTWTSSNVVLNICGEEAHINVCSPKKPGLFSTICYILEKHKISIVSAHISSSHTNRIMYMIQAHAGGGSDQLVDAFPAEEIFKVAVGEIMFWVTSS